MQLKAVSFLNWLTRSQFSITDKGMLVGIQPGIQGHVQMQSDPLYGLGYCNAWPCCTKPRGRLVTDITATCQGPRNSNGMAVLCGDNRLPSGRGARWA